MFYVITVSIVLVFLIDLRSLFFLSNRFLVVQTPGSLSNRLAATLSFTSLWALRLLIFHYLLLLPLTPEALRVVATILLLFPTIIACVYVGFFGFVRSLIPFVLRNYFPVALFIFISTVVMAAGETSWDGSSYHLPIELFIKESGSVWGWPDLIYSQWQLSGIESIFAFYGIAFDSLRVALIVSLFLFFLLFYVFQQLSSASKIFIVLVLISVPALFQQVGTRYIDAIIAILSFLGLVVLKKKSISQSFRFGTYYTTIPIVALAFSGKWTAVTSEFAAFIAVTVLFFNRKEFLNLLKQSLTIVSAFLLGILPIGIRNLVEWDNPIFPYKAFIFDSGYFSLESYSSDLSKLYSSQIGLENSNHFTKIVFEYITTPYLALLELFKGVLSFNFSELLGEELIYRTFVYDNRLSGFGPSLLVILLLYLVYSSNTVSKKMLFVMTSLGLTFLPSFIHSRYYLTVFLVLFWFVLENLEVNKIRAKFFLRFAFPLILVFGIANLATSMYRLHPEGLHRYAIDQSTRHTAQKINPDCSNVFHVGSGVWGVSALWGSDFCGTPIKGENVNGSLFSSKIGEARITSNTLRDLVEFGSKDTKDSRRIVCSFPKKDVNPCDEIYKFFQKNSTVKLDRSGIISEYPTGPNLESMKVIN